RRTAAETAALLLNASASRGQPRDCSNHPTPAEQPNHRRDLLVAVQNSEAREDGEEIVLDEIWIPRRYQREGLRPRVGHVGRGVEPVFEKEEQAEDKAGGLALGEEIHSQKKRDQPLQQRASPEAKRGAEPAEEIVSAFVDDQVGVVDEQESAVGGKRVGQECDVEDEPR